MSCNGCRVLEKDCSPTCTLRTCLPWILSPAAQGHATLFLTQYYGYDELMSRISTVTEDQRGVMFQSLLFEACGRAVNPVTGVAGLQSSGNWHAVQAALNSVMVGIPPRPMQEAPPSVQARLRPPPPAVFMVHNLATLANHPFLVRQAQPPPKPQGSGITEVGSSGSATGQSCPVVARKKRRRRERSEEPEATSSRQSKKPKLLNLLDE